MCRWLAYLGAPIFLSELLFEPENSLIDQSLHARESISTTNGDGFGIGWYAHRAEPGVFRDVLPAWTKGISLLHPSLPGRLSDPAVPYRHHRTRS